MYPGFVTCDHRHAQWSEEDNLLSPYAMITLLLCCNLAKHYWMRNNQNGGWEWNGNLVTSAKYNTRKQNVEGLPLIGLYYFISILTPLPILFHAFMRNRAYPLLFTGRVYKNLSTFIKGCRRGVMFKAMDCGIVVSELELQSRYYVHFRANTLGKGMNPLIPPTMG